MTLEQYTSEKAAQLWGIEKQPKFFDSRINKIGLEANSQKVFRLSPANYRDLANVHAELEFIEKLSQDVNVAKPIPSKKQKLVEVLRHKDVVYYLSAFTMFDGTKILTDEEHKPEVMFNWGQTLARIHQYSRPLGTSIPRMTFEKDYTFKLIYKYLNRGPQKIEKEMKDLIQWRSSLPKDSGFGLIHGDLHQGNFLVDKNSQLQVFDFDDCLLDYYSYDIGLCLFYIQWASIKGSFSHEDKEKQFLKGYESESSPISSQQWAEIQNFKKYRQLYIYFWSHYELVETKPNPDVLKKIHLLFDWTEKG